VSDKTIDKEGAKEADAEKKAFIFPSVDDAKPLEEGGPEARKGFNYQDEIAVAFFIDMLETPSLLKVHCETHDDILLVHALDALAIRIAIFVQVKVASRTSSGRSLIYANAKRARLAPPFSRDRLRGISTRRNPAFVL
jgi:hypothetical protein